MSGGTDPTLYRAVEVASMLRCSEWWVKEQARQRRIPYCWIGGSYRFTDAHLAEIVRLFEVRPQQPAPAEPPARRATGPHLDEPTQLRARPPRRARTAAIPDAA